MVEWKSSVLSTLMLLQDVDLLDVRVNLLGIFFIAGVQHSKLDPDRTVVGGRSSFQSRDTL